MLEIGNITVERKPLHALNRLGFGPRPGDLDRVNRIGVERYIEEQLHPESIPIRQGLSARLEPLDTLRMTPVELFEAFQLPVMKAKGDKPAQKEARRRGRIVLEQAVEGRLVRAIESPRQLEEVMTAFWFNHFNVFAGKGLDRLWIGSYEEEAIRPNALGRFRTLLGATAKHPAMLFYLDNWLNTGPESPGRRGPFEGINENYAREVIELHTLGVNGGYSQRDVTELAHILTGWGIARREPLAFRPWRRNFALAPAGIVRDRNGFEFDPRRHDFGTKLFLGRAFEGSGIQEGEEALDMLARRPATANHLSFELAQYFVADSPPPALVSRMASRYLATDGDIRAVLTTLFSSPEFWDRQHYGAKFKTPCEFVVSSVRATGVEVQNFRPLYGMMAFLGMPLYGCETPNGYSNTRAAWLNPDAMMMRLSFATALGLGNLPLAVAPLDDGVPAYRPKGKGVMNVAMEPGRGGSRMPPPQPAELAAALGDYFSDHTAQAIEAAPPRLRAPLILGSPEFMNR